MVPRLKLYGLGGRCDILLDEEGAILGIRIELALCSLANATVRQWCWPRGPTVAMLVTGSQCLARWPGRSACALEGECATPKLDRWYDFYHGQFPVPGLLPSNKQCGAPLSDASETRSLVIIVCARHD